MRLYREGRPQTLLCLVAALVALAVTASLVAAKRIVRAERTEQLSDAGATLAGLLAADTDAALATVRRDLATIDSAYRKGPATARQAFEQADGLTSAALYARPIAAQPLALLAAYRRPGQPATSLTREVAGTLLVAWSKGDAVQIVAPQSVLIAMRKGDHLAVAYVPYARLFNGFSESNAFTPYLIDSYGKLLAHPRLGRPGLSAAASPVIAAALGQGALPATVSVRRLAALGLIAVVEPTAAARGSAEGRLADMAWHCGALTVLLLILAAFVARSQSGAP